MKSALKIGSLVCIGVFSLGGCRAQSPMASSSASSDAQDVIKNVRPESPKISPVVMASNASLGSEITLALSREPKLQGSSIGVSISNLNGSIMLIGMIQQASQEKLALQIAEQLAKKKTKNPKVISQLKIQAPETSAQGAKKPLKAKTPVGAKNDAKNKAPQKNQ